MLFKNENIDLVAFFSGLLYLAMNNPELLSIYAWSDLLTIFVKIGLIVSFGSIVLRIILRSHRTLILYFNETKYKNETKDFEISQTASDAIKEKIDNIYDSEGNLKQ